MKNFRLLLMMSMIGLSACSRTTTTPTPAPTLPPTTLAPATSAPTPTLTTVGAAPTSEATPTGLGPAATPGATVPAGTSSPTGPLVDRAEFVADITVPDGTDYGPGAKFIKTWRVKNVGTSTWTTQFVIEFVIGANLAANSKVNLPNEAPPGATVDISVEMTAPTTPGNYTSLWQFKNPSGNKFGVGPNFNEAIYVQIDVVAGLVVITPGAGTPIPTASGPLNPVKVTKVTLSVNNGAVTNKCPHTFVFTALLNVEGGGVVKYQLEVSTTTAGFQLQLPTPIESQFNTNTPQTFGASFTLDMRDTVQGQAWLHILSPTDMLSDKVAFSLTCPAQPTRTPVVEVTPSATVKP